MIFKVLIACRNFSQAEISARLLTCGKENNLKIIFFSTRQQRASLAEISVWAEISPCNQPLRRYIYVCRSVGPSVFHITLVEKSV